MTQKKQTKVENAFVISQYYGFEGLELSQIEKEDQEKALKLKNLKDFEHSHLPKIEEAVALLRHSNTDEQKKRQMPILFYSKGEIKNPYSSKKKRKTSESVSLHIIGTPKSIAEANLIKINRIARKARASIKIASLGGVSTINNNDYSNVGRLKECWVMLTAC
jgi:hypothetical protein